ncbi:N-acetyltransferase family protein [Kaarinaea lacus]
MIEIRPAVLDDLVTITQLLTTPDELFLVYPNGRFPFTIPQAQKLYNERFEFTVLSDGDTIAGFANLYDRQQDDHAFIGNVFIAPEYRRQGLGKLLLTYMIKAAFEKYRLREVRLSVFSDNAPAIALYQSFGFRKYSSEQRLDPNNQTRTLVHMKLVNTETDLQPVPI